MRKTILTTFLLVLTCMLFAGLASATPLQVPSGTTDCNGFTINVSGFSTGEPNPIIKFSLTVEPLLGAPFTINDQFSLFPDGSLNFQSSYSRKWSDYGYTLPAGSYHIWAIATFATYNGANMYNGEYVMFSPTDFSCTEQPPSKLTTYTQGGWGSDPHGFNPGSLLHNNFSTVYPNGVKVGGGYKLTFTTAQSITNFLPQGGKPAALNANATNPTKSSAGVFAGQVLALQLSVDFSNANVTDPGLASQNIITIPKVGLPNPGALAGYTVGDVLEIANKVLGGNLAALPAGMSVSQLNDIVDAINRNYDGGTTDLGFLE